MSKKKKKTKQPRKTIKKTTPKVDENELLRVVDVITKKLAYKFKFGYHDIDDMKQQIMVFALEGLKNYDHKRPLENFLWTHVRNRLFNYKRDNYQRPNKPCLTCPLYDPHQTQSRSCCTKYSNKDDCDLYVAWSKRNNVKKNLMHFSNIDKEFDNSDFFVSDNIDTIDNIINNEILLSIEDKLLDEYREIYLKIKNGVKVPKSECAKLSNHIKALLKND